MDIAANAINSLGMDLLRGQGPGDRNVLLSPYSVQTVLAMAYAGAEGETRAEMARALHFPADEPELHRSFADLRVALGGYPPEATPRSLFDVSGSRHGILTTANRLFVQAGYGIRPQYLAVLKDGYDSSLEALDLAGQPDSAAAAINDWIAAQTERRIHDVIMPGAINKATRLLLVNAIYFKAPWISAFNESLTVAESFHLANGQCVDVPTMRRTGDYGYARHDGYTVLSLPYARRAVHLVIVLPDQAGGLASVEARLTAGLIANCSDLPDREVAIHLPRFRIEPPVMAFGEQLQALGMHCAFDRPRGSANFERMAPRHGQDYLAISEVFQKTFLKLDEHGTEAAAATGSAQPGCAPPQEKPPPVEVKVDRPFFFAIQHRESGTCLFMGRVTDPR